MTPKEKAKELFDKMNMIIYTDQDNWKSQCIRCALNAVNEIIIEITDNYDSLHAIDQALYWQQVKTEIKNL